MLTFLARNPIFDIYYQLSKTDKWKKYMSDVDRFISPYQYCENPSEEIGKILSSVGFNKYKIQIMDRIYEYKGIDSLKRKYSRVYVVILPYLRLSLNLYLQELYWPLIRSASGCLWICRKILWMITLTLLEKWLITRMATRMLMTINL